MGAVAVFALSAAVGVLGLKRTATACWLLVALGLFPVAASSLGSFGGAVSLSAFSVIPLITGMLYLISARLDGRSVSVNLRESGRFSPTRRAILQLPDERAAAVAE